MARSIKIGTVNYAAHSLVPAALQSQVLRWQAEHCEFFIGGPDVRGYSPDAIWTSYSDFTSVYGSASFGSRYRDLQLFCEAHGYTFENCFLHMIVDYVAKKPPDTMDIFDVFENAHGVFTLDGCLYVGSSLPFDVLTVTLKTPAVAGQWQYWDGTDWTPLTCADGTVHLTQSGTVTFAPPADWTRTVVDGSWAKYFVRFAADGAMPTVTKIVGDDWRSAASGKNARGWDATSPAIINSGELTYNPTPPPHATARFRHQARLPGNWAPGAFCGNYAYQESGVYVWGAWLGRSVVADSSGAMACMFDGVLGLHTMSVLSPADTYANSDHSQFTSQTPWESALGTYATAVEYIHTQKPGFLIGGNNSVKEAALIGDFLYYEYAWGTIGDGALRLATNLPNSSAARYDSFLPENNPSGGLCLFMTNDTTDAAQTPGLSMFWDRSDWGPMTALATHYICQNENTLLHYYSEGGWRYDETDDIVVYSADTTTLTQPLAQAAKTIHGADFSKFPASGIAKIGDRVLLVNFTKVSNTQLTTMAPILYPCNVGDKVKFVSPVRDRMSAHTDGVYPACENVYRWANYFPAMYVDIGEPDPVGWNNGKRGLCDYRLPSQMYRRDYTKAIMLHQMRNTAYPDRESYETPRQPYSLPRNCYRIHADGTRNGPLAEIALRPGESAVLLHADKIGPLVKSASVNSAGTTLTVVLSESVAVNPSAQGFSLSQTDAKVTTCAVQGTTGTLTLNPPVLSGETPLLSYGGGNVTASESVLVPVADLPIENNSHVSSTISECRIAAKSSGIGSPGKSFIDVPVPEQTAAGDLLVAIGTRHGRTVFSAPPDWQCSQSHYDQRILLFWKIATPADTTGVIRFVFGGVYYGNVVVLRITGGRSVNAVFAGDETTAASVACPPIQVAHDGSLLLHAVAASNDSNYSLADPAVVEEYDHYKSGSAVSLAVYSEQGVNAGPRPGRTVTRPYGKWGGGGMTVSVSPRRILHDDTAQQLAKALMVIASAKEQLTAIRREVDACEVVLNEPIAIVR